MVLYILDVEFYISIFCTLNSEVDVKNNLLVDIALDFKKTGSSTDIYTLKASHYFR